MPSSSRSLDGRSTPSRGAAWTTCRTRSDVRTGLPQRVERPFFGAVRVGGGEHTAALAVAAVSKRWASISGRTPVHRMNAITTSIESADAISALSSCPTAGSPGALVSTVVSSRGVSGASIGRADPSGCRA